jgi:hypothetical protein
MCIIATAIMIWLPVRTLADSFEKLESGFEQQWLMRPLARWYQNNVSHELAKYGKSIFRITIVPLVRRMCRMREHATEKNIGTLRRTEACLCHA